jgi:para-aminobenzoate synthetase / 4-amino-4-deoxychorismate lyase
VLADLPAELVPTARSADGILLGVRHVRHPVEGVQVHPESILTPHGSALLSTFLRAADAPKVRHLEEMSKNSSSAAS